MGTSSSKQMDIKYGWRRELPDHNDQYYEFNYKGYDSNIKNIDLRCNCPEIYDQGKLGSCTANAVAGAYQYEERREDKKVYKPSRLFIYYNERVLEDTVLYDSGATIRDSIKTLYKTGTCSEEEWPYDISKFKTRPNDTCYKKAQKNKIIEYKKITQTLDELRACLQQGTPFVFGFSVYESFENNEVANTGIMKIPRKGEKLLGGHAVMAVGYDDTTEMFIIRNSWGPYWGELGYFYMPYEFMINDIYASDFWTIKKID